MPRRPVVGRVDLRSKLAVLLVAVTLVLSLATVGGLELYKRGQIDRTQTDVSETAALAAGQIEARLADRRDYVAFIAQRAAGEPADGPLLGEMLDNSRFLAARVVTPDGTVVALRGPYAPDRRRSLVGASASADPCVRETLATGDICVGEPARSGPDRRYRVGIAAPVFEGNRTVGVLQAAVRLDEATLFGSLEPLRRESQAVTVSADGRVLSSREGRIDRPIVGEATVEPVGWEVDVRRDRARLDDRLGTVALAQAGGIFLVAALAVLVGYWEYGLTLRQTGRLLDGFRALERGAYDRRLSLSGAREWEEISDGFNGLAETLAAREAALREREQRLEVLNRLIRHNLRNEMNVILGHARRLREADDDADDTRAEAVAAVVAAGERLLSRGEKARRTARTFRADADPRPLDAAPLVREAVETVRASHPETPIDCSVPDPLPARGLPALREAVRELVANACEHGDDVSVDVTATVTAEATLVRVADDGPGLPAVERRTLASGGETPTRHGSGIGLWLVRWIVDRCDGSVSFDEPADGGTVATVRLPRADERAIETATTDDA
jgi:signal transduction histidine kinase